MEGTAPNSAYVSHIICYNCGKQGHFQADCKEEAFCVKCNKPGHVSVMCAALRNVTEPFWAGYGVDGIGFTCCEVQDEELLAPAPNTALVILEQGTLSETQMEEELKDLVDEEWEWRVQKLNDTDFAVFSPPRRACGWPSGV
jgi:hypothetical protein